MCDKQIIVYILSMVMLISGCNMEQRIEAAQNDLMKEYHAIPEWNQRPEKILSWEQAYSMMLKNNIELKKLKKSIREAEIQKQRVLHDFIPGIDLGHYYNAALIKSDTSMSPYSNFDVNVIFNIPALTQLPVDHYTRSMALFTVQKQLEQKQRELTAKLWKLFREAELEGKQTELEDAATKNRFDNHRLKKKERELKEREKTQELCQLLNDYNARWKPLSSSRPSIQWHDYRKKAKAPDDLTQIIMALQLEAARLQKLGIALQYLPKAQINFFSPSLFSMSGGANEGFMSRGQEVRLNLNIYMQLDTKLEIWSNWSMAKENYNLVKEELTQQMHEYRNKMQLLLDSWQTYDDWKKSTEEYIDFRRSQGVCTPEDMKTLYEEDIALQKEMLEQESKNIERECALIQEYGLK